MRYRDERGETLTVSPNNGRRVIVLRIGVEFAAPGAVLVAFAAEDFLTDMVSIAEAWGLGGWEPKR